jgi:RNA polymerase sigma factor (sigma-70 family)
MGHKELEQIAERLDKEPVQIDGNTINGAISMTLTSLPPHYQEALVAKYMKGESLEAMSKRLGLSVKGVGSLLTRAREAFKEEFKRIAKED